MFFYAEPEPILYITSSLLKLIEPSLNNSDITLVNGPIYSPEYGGQYIFDGINDQANFISSLNGITARKFTISAWISIPSGTLNRGQYLFSNKSSRSWVQHQQMLTRWNGFDAWIENGYVYANINMSRPPVGEIVYDTGFSTIRSGVKLTETEFNNITISSNGGESYSNGFWRQSLDIHINGIRSRVAVGSYGSVSLWSHGNTVIAGRGAQNAYSAFSGSMSSFAFYNEQLTDAQILQNYNAFKSRFGR